MAYSGISKSKLYFEATTYTGGATDVSSLSFQPDFVWAKKRDGSENHGLFDSVRGATKTINSNTTATESTRSGSLTSFDSDGWTMGGSDGIISASGSTYVGWAWKAGTTGSGTTDQSKDYQYSVNTTSGFSIVRYKGSGVTNHKIPHHLGAKPEVILVKSIESVHNWTCYWDIFQNSQNYVRLNNDDTVASDATKWGGYATASTINLGSANDTNQSSSSYNFVAYSFVSKKGYSAFGKYRGNGNADGTFVYTGFKPAWVMHKRTDTSNNWIIQDNKRNGFNADNPILKANLSDAEQAVHEIDFVSNGFKVRSSGAGSNASGGTYIYMAFAEEPLVANVGQSIPATAR